MVMLVHVGACCAASCVRAISGHVGACCAASRIRAIGGHVGASFFITMLFYFSTQFIVILKKSHKFFKIVFCLFEKKAEKSLSTL